LSNPVESTAQAPSPMSIVREGLEGESEDEGIGPATIAALKRGRLIDARMLPEADSVKAGNPAKLATTNAPVAPVVPLSVRMGTMPGLPSQPAPMGRSTMVIPSRPLGPPPSIRPPAPQPTLQAVAEERTPTAAKPRGLTNRRMLEISNPIPRSSRMFNEAVAAVAFERPRPAPLVLQGANNREPAAPMTRPDGSEGSFF
jgi:antitoxin (DNA-binding transcriptional repressor) of toxin-antitoxin stability system